MFDAFDMPHEQINEAIKQSAINHIALLMALLDANVITQEQYLRAIPKATHKVDQHYAAMKEQEDKEFAKQHPGAAWLAKTLKESMT